MSRCTSTSDELHGGDLHDRLVAEACRVAQPAGGHAPGRHDVARQDGHVVVQALGHLEGLELSMQVGEDEQLHGRRSPSEGDTSTISPGSNAWFSIRPLQFTYPRGLHTTLQARTR